MSEQQELYQELYKIIADLDGYKDSDSLSEPMEDKIAYDVVTVLKELSTDEQRRGLNQFTAAALDWAAEYNNSAVRADINVAIQTIKDWLGNLAEYKAYQEEQTSPVHVLIPDSYDRG